MKLGNALKTAWQRTFQHKALWLFGLLVLYTNAISFGNLNFRNSGQVDPNQLQPQFEKYFSTLDPERFIAVSGVFIVLILAIGILSFFISHIGQTGLTKGVLMVQENQPAEYITVSNLYSFVKKNYWANIRLSILTILINILMVIILGIPFACLGGLLAKNILFAIPIWILAVLGVLIVKIIESNARFTLNEKGYSARDSIKTGWEITKENFWRFLLVHLLTMLFIGLVNFVISLPVLILTLPAIRTMDLSTLNFPLLIILSILTSTVIFFSTTITNPFVYHTLVQYYDRYKYGKSSGQANTLTRHEVVPPAY